MKSMVGCAVWLITAIASMHWGLLALGNNVFEMFLGANAAQIELLAQYAAGIAGAVSLAMLVQHWMTGRDSCGCK